MPLRLPPTCMPKMRLAVCVATLLAFSIFCRDIYATRVEFIATQGEARLEGSEVCFFSATVDDGFFQKFFSSADVRCLSADAVIQMPLGNWNIFARHSGAYTSTHPTMQLSDYETEAQRDAYRPQRLVLRPAGMVRVPLPTKELRPVVYLPNLQYDEPASVRPAVFNEESILVPADTPVVPLLVRGLRIVGVGEPLTVGHKAKRDAIFPPVPDKRRDVVVLLRLSGHPDDGDDIADPVDIRLEVDGETIRPVVPIRTGRGIDRSLAIFRNVSTADGAIVVDGEHWMTQRVALAAGTDPVFEPSALVLRRAAKISAAWSRPAHVPSCRRKQEPAKRATVTLQQYLPDNSMREIASLPATSETDEGIVTFADLAPGRYRVKYIDPDFGALSEDIVATQGQTSTVRLAHTPVRVSGKVTMGDRGLAADLSFATGETTTDRQGYYSAYLRGAPGLETVTVLPCDGSLEYIASPTQSLDDGSTFDIVVPDSTLDVRVVEAPRGTPLKDANVSVAVLLGRDDIERYYLDAPLTTKEGHTSLRRVPTDAWMHICASRAGFTQRCSDPFTLNGEMKRTMELALSRDEMVDGALVGGDADRFGTLFWIAPDGTITERSPVRSDGSFRYSPTHMPLEHLVLAARNYPMYIFAVPPDIASGGLRLELRPRPTRQFQIVPGKLRNARLALEVDRRLIPETVFSTFQGAKGLPIAIHDNVPIPVRDIAGTEIALLVGPPTNFFPADLPRDRDPWSFAGFRSLFRRIPVNGATVDVVE